MIVYKNNHHTSEWVFDRENHLRNRKIGFRHVKVGSLKNSNRNTIINTTLWNLVLWAQFLRKKSPWKIVTLI
jgi:hypothetical protein